MECKEAQVLLNGYIDGELDAAHAVELEAHLRDCKACFALHQRQLALRSAVRGAAPYHPAPEALRRRISAALREEAPVATAPPARPRFSFWPAAMAAAAMACVMLVTFVVWRASQPGQEQLLAAQILDRHLGSLQASHLMDVPSSDKHTVKPWFAGKLDFSPPVPDFPDQGFDLVGGRLDHVNGRAVAALVYKRREHVINLFVWPADSPKAVSPRSIQMHGYNLLSWSAAGMNYWAVSDLNAKELEELSGRVLGATSKP